MPVILGAYTFAGVLFAIADHVRGKSVRCPLRGERAISLSTVILVTAWLVLTLVAGLRSWDVGPDSIMYAQQFVVDPTLIRTWTTPLYSLACFVLSSVSAEFWPILFMVMAAATFAFLISALWRQSAMPWLSLLIIVCFGFGFEVVNQYRQFLAVAMVLYAVGDLMEGNRRRYVALVLVAATIHITALVALTFLLAGKVPISNTGMLVSIVIVAVLFLLGLPAVRPLISKVPYFGNYIGSSHDTGPDMMTVLTFLFRFGVFAVLLLVCSHENGKQLHAASSNPHIRHACDQALVKDARICLGVQIVYMGMLVQAMAMSFHLVARVPTYMMCVLAILLPNVLVRKPQKMRRLLLVITLAAFIALFAGLMFLRDYSGYAYSFVWERQLDVQSIPRTGW